MSEEPTALNAGGKDGIVGAVPNDGAEGVAPEPADGAVFPASVGTLVFVIDLTCANPDTTAAPAAANPSAGPIIGIPC